jgi:hypothetical protein
MWMGFISIIPSFPVLRPQPARQAALASSRTRRAIGRRKAETLYVKDSQGKLSAKTNKGLEEGEYWFEK